MRIAVLAGGYGGAKFVAGLRAAVQRRGGAADDITVIVNTADDIRLFDLDISPDLDTLMYALGDGLDTVRGWGRRDEGWRARDELAAYGIEGAWFGLGDRDLATHLVRTQMLRAGYPLHLVTRALCRRWRPGVRLLPMTDDRVQTHVVVADGAGSRALHFQEWWIRHHAELPAQRFVVVGAEAAAPAPGVLDALAGADAILLAPSNPVVSIGPILAVPGLREALHRAPAPVVGVSPIIGGSAVRGMAAACLTAIGVPVTAAAVAVHYGARRSGGVLDAWVLDDVDAAASARVAAAGIAAHAAQTLMTDPHAAETLADAALALALALALATDGGPEPTGGRATDAT